MEGKKERDEPGSRPESRRNDLLRDRDADRGDSVGVLQERSELGKDPSGDVAGDL